MATMREVAKRAGVSVATVSMVLNNTKPVTPEVRQRVEKALTELDYRPNALARGLFKGKTRVIAFLVPSVSNPVFGENAAAIEEYANQNGYSVFIANTRGSRAIADDHVNRLIEMRVDGVIMTLTWENARDELVERLHRHGIRVVGVSGSYVRPDIDCFMVDEEGAGYALGRYLLSLGHEQCAFVGTSNSAVTQLRMSGLQRAFAESGYAIPGEAVVWADSAEEKAREDASARLLASLGNYSCVVASYDLLATSVLKKLLRQKISIPEHLAVATFGDHYARITVPGLTTMTHSEYEIGRLAVKRLLETIDDPAPSPVSINLEKRLVVRESTGPVSTDVHGHPHDIDAASVLPREV